MTAEQHRQLFNMAAELATEIRCLLIDNRTDQARAAAGHLLARYARLINNIEQNAAASGQEQTP